jgi:hypothetical protein
MMQNGLNVVVLPVIGITADLLGIPFALDILAVAVLTVGLASIYLTLRDYPRRAERINTVPLIPERAGLRE